MGSMQADQNVERLDLVVIGAGWHGLMAAKTYLDVNPSARVAVLDKSATIGGVWAEHRLYPGLKTNNMLGTYEYSDFPMSGENAFGVKPGEHIPGQVVHAYLKKFAETFGIYEKCRFSQEVLSAEKIADSETTGSGWILTTSRDGDINKLHTRKLVVATGLTSQTYVPRFTGADQFGAPIIHCANLLDDAENLFATAKNVAVFGGTKSAWDAAYAFASRGIHVDWIIRESGHGPCWMAPPLVTPMKKWLEKLVTTRFLTWFSPCAWGDADGFTGMRGFLHGTTVGRAVVNGFWGILGSDVISLNGYDKHPETAKLKPWVDAFWIAAGLSILNYPTNFFDLVKEGRISIHIGDITHLSEKTIHLKSTKEGEEEKAFEIKADTLICSTGWNFVPPIKFLSPGGAPMDPALIGLPYHSTSPSAEEESPLTKSADEEILTRFPVLKNQPKLNPKLQPLRDESTTPNRPFNLYKFMIPPAFVNDRSIVFNGMVQTICTPLLSQAQALWLTAFLDGRLKLPEEEEKVKKETMLHNRFGKWRYPGGYGAVYPDFVFDALPYVDMLLKDLGLNGRRKGGVMKEMFEPYGTADYAGLVEEWKRKQGLIGESTEPKKG